MALAFNQRLLQVDLPNNGDEVPVWGAWANDKPNGWNEVHPAWKVVQKYLSRNRMIDTPNLFDKLFHQTPKHTDSHLDLPLYQ